MFIKKLLNSLLPKGGDDKAKEPSMVTNKVLYKELVEHFKTQMEELSVAQRVLYPMSFNILLHPDDYARVGESLPFILPEVIAGFYAAIKEKSHGMDKANTIPTASYWFFQFAASKVKTDEGKDEYIKLGEIVTVGSLKTFDIKKQHAVREDNVQLSVKCQNSIVNQNNINPKALLGMEIVSDNAFVFNYDDNLSEDRNDIQASLRSGKNTLATLSYSDGPTTARYSMMDKLIIVSGVRERREMGNIIVIGSEAVEVGHVQIRYLKETNRFQLCAYAKTRLNQREVPLSVGGAPIWVDMSYNSDIFLNDEVNLKFKASEGIVSREGYKTTMI